MVVTDNLGQRLTTLFDQYTLVSGGQRLGRITFPNGLKESYFYESTAPRLSSLSYDFCTGYWNGFKSAVSLKYPLDPSTRTKWLLNSLAVSKIVTSAPDGSGQTIQILRMKPVPPTPADVDGTGAEPAQLAFTTTIMRYPTPNPVAGVTPYRGVHLVHPHLQSFGSDNLGRQAFLVSSGVILKSVRFAGSSLVPSPDARGNWQPTAIPDNELIETQLFDGWDNRSWANPTGGLSHGLPSQPVALRTRVIPKGLPMRTTLAGIAASQRDERGPIMTEEYTDAPPVTAPTINELSPVLWWDQVSAPSSATQVKRNGQITRSFDEALAALNVQTDQKALAGEALPQLRFDGSTLPNPVGVTSVSFGTTTHTVANGLITKVTGDRGSYSAVEDRTYLTGTPLVTRVTKSLTGPSGAILARPGDSSVQAGHEYGYDTTPHQWLQKERDLVDGRWTTYVRDALGKETSRTDVMGVTTTTDYDAMGRISKVTRTATGTVGAAVTEYTYDVVGRSKEEKTTIEGRTLIVHTDFDAFDRPVTVIKKKVNGTVIETQTTIYDGWGQKIRQTPVLKTGQSSYGDFKWVYDDQGRLSETWDRFGGTTPRLLSKVLLQPTSQPATTVDGVSIPAAIWTKVQDASGIYTRSTATDILGQKIAVVDQKGKVSQFWYGKDGHLIKTGQGNQSRLYEYNDMGWMTSRTEPEEGRTEYSNHNLLGTPLTTQMRGRPGNTTWSQVTTLNANLLPDSITASGDEGTVTRNLIYRPDHLLSSFSETQALTGIGTLSVGESYGYDDLFRLSSKTVTDYEQSFTVTRSLDAAGNVTSLTYPGGLGRAAQTVTTTFDDQFRPYEVLSGATTSRARMTYDLVSGSAVSNTLLYGNGTKSSNKADLGELVETRHEVLAANGLLQGTVQSNAIAWDPRGLMTQRGGDSFGYDSLQRLTQATTQGIATGEQLVQTFDYDRYGNRTSNGFAYTPWAGQSQSNRPAEVLAWTATYTSGNDLPATVGTTGGPLLTGAQYDDLGRMKQVWAVPGDSSELTTWAYDPLGRVVKEMAKGVSSTFLLDGEGLRFRRTRLDGFVQYTVYGFNREPLMVFEKPAPASGQSQLVTTKTSSKTSTQSLTPPKCTATITKPTGPTTVWAGATVSFTGTGTLGDTFYWTFGDGGTAGGKSATHAFATVGTYTVTFKVADSGGDYGLGTATVVITVVQQPAIGSFTATPVSITLGQSSTLSWTATGATTLSISGIGTVTGTSRVVSPTVTTTYTLTATNGGGSVSSSLTVTVNAPPPPLISAFSASPTAINLGQTSTLSWTVTGATTLSISGIGTVTGTSRVVTPTATTTYTLTATSPYGTASQSLTVTIVPILQWKKTLTYGFGQLLCEENASGPGLVYIQSDHVGSPNIMTDNTGTVIGRTKNLPYGERFGASGTQASRRFTNHEDQAGSAIYMQARMYLPAYGKFAQVDPAYDQTKDDPESWNLYGYVTNNPVTKTDPDGRMFLNEGSSQKHYYGITDQSFFFLEKNAIGKMDAETWFPSTDTTEYRLSKVDNFNIYKELNTKEATAKFKALGLQTDLTKMTSADLNAIAAFLYDNSPTYKGLIDSIKGNGLKSELIVNHDLGSEVKGQTTLVLSPGGGAPTVKMQVNPKEASGLGDLFFTLGHEARHGMTKAFFANGRNGSTGVQFEQTLDGNLRPILSRNQYTVMLNGTFLQRNWVEAEADVWGGRAVNEIKGVLP